MRITKDEAREKNRDAQRICRRRRRNVNGLLWNLLRVLIEHTNGCINGRELLRRFCHQDSAVQVIQDHDSNARKGRNFQQTSVMKALKAFIDVGQEEPEEEESAVDQEEPEEEESAVDQEEPEEEESAVDQEAVEKLEGRMPESIQQQESDIASFLSSLGGKVSTPVYEPLQLPVIALCSDEHLVPDDSIPGLPPLTCKNIIPVDLYDVDPSV